MLEGFAGRARWRRRAAEREKVSGASKPPPPDVPFTSIPILAIDLETTGLEVDHDHILSFGWVILHEGCVKLGSARHLVVSTTADIDLTASGGIHGLTHDQLDTGGDLQSALSILVDAAPTGILLAHGAAIEQGFIAHAMANHADGDPHFIYLDTLAFERKRLSKKGVHIASDSLRLDAARDRYGLPRYQAHNAVTDALACAELALAQDAHSGGTKLWEFLIS